MSKTIDVSDWQCPRCDYRETFLGMSYLDQIGRALLHFEAAHPEALDTPTTEEDR